MDSAVKRRRFVRTASGVTAAVLFSNNSFSAVTRTSTAQEPTESWGQFGYDDANTGHAPNNSGPTDGVGERWVFETGEGTGDVQMAPVVADGTVYFASRDGYLYAIEEGTGVQRWTFETGGSGAPVVEDGTVYVGTWDDTVSAVDVDDGSARWSFETGSYHQSSPVVTNGTVYVVNSGGDVHALAASDGTEQWRCRTGVDRYGGLSPAVSDGTLYVPSYDGPLYALNTADGTERWVFEADDGVESAPAVMGGTVYVGTSTGVLALDAESGTREWTADIENRNGVAFGVGASPAVADDSVYVGSGFNRVHALAAADGTQRWQSDVGDTGPAPVVVDGAVYLTTRSGNVYALDTADGAREWTFSIDDTLNSPPAVANGTIYFGGETQTLYALTGAGSTPTATPTSTPTPVPDSTRTAPADTPTRSPSTETADAGGTDEDERDLLPIAIALLGAGGVGAWWLGRGGDDEDGDHRAGDTPADGPGRAPSEPGPSAADASPAGAPSAQGSSAPSDGDRPSDRPESTEGGEPLSVVDGLRDRGQSLREEASNYSDAHEYDRALVAYEDARAAYEEALEIASDSDPVDTAPLERALADIEDGQRDVRGRRLHDDVDTIRADLARAGTLAERQEFEEAGAELDELASAIESATETALRYDFDDLHEDLTALERRREHRLEDVSERLHPNPVPDTIPRAPDIPIEYDALIDREPIGGGGNADVTKATFPTPNGGVTLAIKEPRMSGTLHTAAVERMLAEAETWDKLDDHDHIVGVIDYGSSPIPWIAMEYMDAGHLGDRCGEMDVPQALWTAISVTKGVRHAHRRGVVHLDLKPANVLFRSVADAWDVPKVADWGLSKHLLEHSTSVEGMSVAYAAPEQFDDAYGSTDDITDVYQLGAVFYELFTGRPPFEGQPFEVIDMIKNDRPTPPSEIADVPDALGDILSNALAKEKGDRYDDIVYLRDDLQSLFDDR